MPQELSPSRDLSRLTERQRRIVGLVEQEIDERRQKAATLVEEIRMGQQAVAGLIAIWTGIEVERDTRRRVLPPSPVSNPPPVAKPATRPTGGSKVAAYDIVRAFFEAQTAPVTRKDVLAGVAAAKNNVVRALEQLRAEGVIATRGVRRGQILGLPAVVDAAPMPAARRSRAAGTPPPIMPTTGKRRGRPPGSKTGAGKAATAPPPEDPTPTRVHTRKLAASDALSMALLSKLRSGASYDAKVLWRAARAAGQTADIETVTAAVEALATAGQVERIPVGESLRYRLRAKRLRA